VEKVMAFIWQPFEAKVVKQGAEVNSYLKSITPSKLELLKQVSKLQSQVNDLNTQLLQLKSVAQENKDLRDILDFTKQEEYSLVLVDVIYKNNWEVEKSIVINKGAAAGISKGDAVIIGKGLLIGAIIKVDSYKSLVRLTIDNNSRILATLEDVPQNIAGVLAGWQGNGLSLDLVPKNITVFPGQKVITNGLQERIPANLYLGEVLQLDENENKIFNSALINPLYNIEDLKIAAVVVRLEGV
jgi:rod shape-determining protein MreC